jgi:hypothetical protein
VWDIAGALLEPARLDIEPPTLVRIAQEAMSWLSRAIAELEKAPLKPRAASPRRSLACSPSGPSLTSR